jgi:hypothetical protein
MQKFIKYSKVPPVVRTASLPPGVSLIMKDQLDGVVLHILGKYIDKDKHVSLSKKEIKNNIYKWVIDFLREKKLFYKGLNQYILMKIIEDLSYDYIFKDNSEEERNVLMEEYDHIVWRKINELDYPKDRFQELQKILKIQ